MCCSEDIIRSGNLQDRAQGNKSQNQLICFPLQLCHLVNLELDCGIIKSHNWLILCEIYPNKVKRLSRQLAFTTTHSRPGRREANLKIAFECMLMNTGEYLDHYCLSATVREIFLIHTVSFLFQLLV